MSIEEIEAKVLSFDAKDRARLAERLLESLEQLSDDENEMLWAEEAACRDAAWDESSVRPALVVLRDALSRLQLMDKV